MLFRSVGKTCSEISVARYTPSVAGTTSDAVVDPSFVFEKRTIGLYDWDNTNKGLICYYRINIFDTEFGNDVSMHYSVIRNNAYHVNITGVNSIGYPKAEDVIVNPDTPLIDFPTYMQVEISINKWTAKDMNTNIGM